MSQPTNAGNTKRSKEVPVQDFIRPLEQAVVPLFSTLSDKQYSEQEKDEMIRCLLIILEALSFEMQSGDAWILAMGRATKNAELLGIVDFQKYGYEILEMRKKVAPSNPMSGMF